MNTNSLCINDMSALTTMPVDLIKFCNVKSKYFLNEDIVLEYVLDSEVQPSYRDWIGLYPRGWTNLLQYITFEWIISRPCEVALRRNILFRCRHHSQVVHSDREYQFLYINKQIEVLGHSQYFKFQPVDTLSNTRKNVHRISSERALLSNLSLQSDSPPQMIMSPRSCASVSLMEGQQRQMFLMKQQQQRANSQALSSELALATSDVPSFFHMNTQSQIVTTCSYCNRPADFSYIQQTFENKVKSSAEQIRNLEHRIQDLENDIEMNQVAQKRLRLAAHHSKRERMAYQKFVNELLFALSHKGVVRVVDGQGTQMLVKRVLNNGTRTDVEEHSPQNAVRTSPKERMLKAVIGSQEQTIRDLLTRLDSTTKACNNLALKMDLVTVDGNNTEEEFEEFSDTKETAKQMPKSVIAVVPHGQGDMAVDFPEPEKGQNGKSNNMETVSISEPVINEDDENETFVSASGSGNLISEFPSHDEVESVCSVVKLADEIASKQFLDDSSEPVSEKIPVDINNKSSTKTKTPEKPSALVIEGDTMKFAIIRY